MTNFYCLIFFWKIANVPQKYEANHPLGVWVNKQRMEMKAKLEGRRTNMTDRRIDLLTTIGFEWAKPKGQAAWNEKYKELIKYKEQYGDCMFFVVCVCVLSLLIVS